MADDDIKKYPEDRPGIILLPEGVSMRRPEEIPEENWNEPEFTSWRERAFDLANKLNKLEEENRATLRQLVLTSEALDEVRDRLKQIHRRFDVRVVDWMIGVFCWLRDKMMLIVRKATGRD